MIALPCSVLLITPAASTLLCSSSAPGMLLFLPSIPFVMDGGQGRLLELEELYCCAIKELGAVGVWL